MICTSSRIKILSALSFLCQLSVVVLVNTILAWLGIPFFLIPTFATCDGDEGNTHEVSPLFTLVPLAPAPHPLVTISHHWESSTITGKSLSNKGYFRMLDPSSYYGFTNPMARGEQKLIDT